MPPRKPTKVTRALAKPVATTDKRSRVPAPDARRPDAQDQTRLPSPNRSGDSIADRFTVPDVPIVGPGYAWLGSGLQAVLTPYVGAQTAQAAGRWLTNTLTQHAVTNIPADTPEAAARRAQTMASWNAINVPGPRYVSPAEALAEQRRGERTPPPARARVPDPRTPLELGMPSSGNFPRRPRPVTYDVADFPTVEPGYAWPQDYAGGSGGVPSYVGGYDPGYYDPGYGGYGGGGGGGGGGGYSEREVPPWYYGLTTWRF